MDGAALIVADGEKGLADHGLEPLLGDDKGVLILHGWQLGEFLWVGAQDVELAHAAPDVDHVVFGGKEDGVVGHLADDLAEEAGGEHQGALFLYIGGDNGADTGLQVIAGQAQLAARLQENTLQGGDGALGGDGPAGGRDSGLEQGLLTGKFHGTGPPFPSLLFRGGSGEERLYRFVVTVVGNVDVEKSRQP